MRPAEKLVMMANQIARNLAVQGEEAAIAATADHLRRFWDPRMRAAIIAYVAEGGGSSPIADAAVRRLGDVPIPFASALRPGRISNRRDRRAQAVSACVRRPGGSARPAPR